MKKTNTAERLKEIMQQRDLKQSDILKLCQPYCEKYGEKIGKPHLSQWVSGINEPNQRKLFILGQALNISEPWLMGYDVPMERSVAPSKRENKTSQEEQLLYYFNSLESEEDKKRILRMLKSYVDSEKNNDGNDNCG